MRQQGLFGDLWLVGLAGLALLGLILQQPAVLLLSLALLVTIGATWAWVRASLRSVDYQRSFSANRAFHGETVELRLRVVNRKLLPLPWLETQDEFPEAVPVEGRMLYHSYNPTRRVLTNLFSLRWYESVTRRYRLLCHTRGYYNFGPVTLRSGDIFGFFTSTRTAPGEDYLLVYPRVLPLESLSLPTRQLLGSLRSRQRLLTDPMRVIGVRDYSQGDSLKLVHWKATARAQRLQVKVLEAASSLDLLIFLNVSTFVPEWQGTVPELLESAVTLAASMASHALEQGNKVGLCANTNLPGSDQPLRIPASRNAQQQTRVLEALAKVNGLAVQPCASFVREAGRHVAWGGTIALITAITPEPLLAEVAQLRRSGRTVALIPVIGGLPPDALPDIHPAELAPSGARG